jgi:Ca2+-binding RTX toxin-like protein
MLVALGVILAIALIAGGVAVLARSGGSGGHRGTNGPDHLIGTSHADRLQGRRGADVIDGRGGGDALSGGPGFDQINGGGGGDRIQARDRHLDAIDCGPGRHDTAIVDRAEDGVFDCERVIAPKTFQKAGGRR